jgi:hypothetical protein
MSRPTALETGEPRFAARRLTTMTPRLATLAVLVVLAACQSDPDPGASAAPDTSIPSIDDFDDGYGLTSELTGRWLDADGEAVADGLIRGEGPSPMTLNVTYGPDHCDWDEIVMLDLSWPLGTEVTVYTEDVRQYARDADGTFGDRLRTTFAADVEAPEDVTDTGYHRQGNRLLVGPTSAAGAVYVARPDGTVERWPRVVPPAICA